MKLLVIDVEEKGKTLFSTECEYEPGIDPALLPCPFCGSKEITVSIEGVVCGVGCDKCGAGIISEGILDAFTSKTAAQEGSRKEFEFLIRTWNTRTPSAS